jgi:hypothetical protein
MNNPGVMQTLHSMSYLAKHIPKLIVSDGIPVLLHILQYIRSIHELQHFNGYLFIDTVGSNSNSDSDSSMAVIAMKIIMMVLMLMTMMAIVMTIM